VQSAHSLFYWVEAWIQLALVLLLACSYEMMDILQLFKKRDKIRTTGTGPRLIKFQKRNTWSEEDSVSGELLSRLEHPFFPKRGVE
jgi:hypothetical protein